MRDRRASESRASARLLLGPEAPPDALASPALGRLLGGAWPPSPPVRFAQELQRKLGFLNHERAVTKPMMAERRGVLGAAALGPPRFLVRVDEFPHCLSWDEPERYGTAEFERFHSIMAEAGVPYLLAVLPRVSHAALDPAPRGWRALDQQECDVLERLPGDGVSFGLHGLDHRTRHLSPRRRSELCGLSPEATEHLIDQGLATLAGLGIEPRVFVPPFNRFDVAQYEILARRFAVICGGLESIGVLGFHRTPVWRGSAAYLPAYEPLYGHAREVLPTAQRLIEAQAALWTPIVLHWAWESDDSWEALERLVAAIAPYAVCWEEFLAEVDAVAASF